MALLLLGTACSSEQRLPAVPRNLLLITVDTLRADHLSAYGYEQPTSPAIDALAARGLLFERAYSVASWTLPSVISLMTSLYPSAHSCQADDSALPELHTTLAETLARAGFRTGAVTSHSYLSTRYGLEQGFADFDEELVHKNRKQSHKAISSPAITAKGTAWLAEREREDDGRWFLWLHYFDPHSEYLPHPELAHDFGPGQRGLYDGEVAFTDRSIGELLARLDELGEREETLIVLLADHGEELGDHGSQGHRATLYEEVLRVPLIVACPGLGPRRVLAPVSCIDVLPTIMELLRLTPPAPIEGRSLVPSLLGLPLEPRSLHAEMRNRNRKDWDGLVEGHYKLLRDVTAERTSLYDLAEDPHEQHDLATRRPELLRELQGRMADSIARSRALAEQLGQARAIELAPEDIRQLEQLGYGGDH